MKRALVMLLLLAMLATPANAMLAKYYRIRIKWVADQTLTYNDGARVTVSLMPWKITTAGALEYDAENKENTTYLNAGETIATGEEEEGTVVDNSSDLYWGFKGYVEVTADVTSTDGTMYVYLEESPDNSVWPSDQADFDVDDDLIFLCALEMSTDAEDEDRTKNFSY